MVGPALVALMPRSRQFEYSVNKCGHRAFRRVTQGRQPHEMIFSLILTGVCNAVFASVFLN